MGYVDYEYYTATFLGGTAGKVSSENFPKYEKLAELEIDARTCGRASALSAVPDKLKDCVCAVMELLCEADTQSEVFRSQGLAGPIASWSNDGQSGSVDLGQSVLTESGKRTEIGRLCRLYLGATGLLYAGVMHYES